MTDTAVPANAASMPGAQPPLPPEALAEQIRRALEDDALSTSISYGLLTVDVAPAAFGRAARLCKTSEALAFDFFDFLCGVDAGEDGFFVVVHLYSTTRRHHVQLRMLAPGGRDEPVAPSITSVYGGANWSEREAYDMYGITFTDHPGLLPRMLTVENFEGWPLRKDFLLMTREVKPWPGAKEPEERKDHAGEEGGPERPAATGVGDASGPSTAGAGSGMDKAEAAKAKAERAKAKAAEMRAKKATERAAAQQAAAGSSVEGEAAAAAATTDQEPGRTEPDRTEPDSTEPDSTEPDSTEPDSTEPDGAAAIADTDIAKDAAAGAVQGDVAAGAPGDSPTSDQPIDNPEHEAVAAEGGAPTASGAPGVEAEGRHGGAEVQSGERPAADTPGMTSDRPGHAAEGLQATAPAPQDGPGGATAAAAKVTRTDEPGGADVPVRPAPGSENAPVATDPQAPGQDSGTATEVAQDAAPIDAGGTDAADRSAAPDTRTDPEASDSPETGAGVQPDQRDLDRRAGEDKP